MKVRSFTAPLLAATVLVQAQPACAADIKTHTPNIPSPHLVEPGHSQFSFTHRFEGGWVSLSNDPTFWLEGGIVPHLAWQLQYATKAIVLSPASAAITGPHDIGISLRENAIDQRQGAPVTLTFQEGYEAAGFTQNQGGGVSVATTTEGALATVGHEFSFGRYGGIGVVGTVRGERWNFADLPGMQPLGPGQRFGGAIGATYQITPYLSIGGDWGKYFDGIAEVPAWSAALEGLIPYTPHRFTLEVSDVPTVTMAGQGQSEAGHLYVGFSYLIPFDDTMRWQTMVMPAWAQPAGTPPANVGDADDSEGAPAATPASASAPTAPLRAAKAGHVVVKMTNFAFVPKVLTIPAGTIVTWLNTDPVAHTATAKGQSWNTGMILPGASASITFARPGRFPYYCIPHQAFMKGTIIVTP